MRGGGLMTTIGGRLRVRGKRGLAAAVAGVVVITMSAGTALAATAVGGDQDFTDGTILSNFFAFDAASRGEAAPFDRFRGSDPGYAGPIDDEPPTESFDEQFTLTLEPGSYASGDFTLGIYDHDSATPGSQLFYFGVDGVDLTTLLDQALESRGGTQAEYNVYTIALPAAALAEFADGAGTFRLALQGPTIAESGESLPYNGAGLDFARLDLVPAGTGSSDPAGAVGEAIADLGLSTEDRDVLLYLLNAAEDYVADGGDDAATDAVDKLEDLIDKTQDYVENGTITQADGDNLIALVQDFIDSIES